MDGFGLDELHIFESLPQNYLLLSPDLSILAVSDAYLELTEKKRSDLVGQKLFDVFPVATHWAPETDGGIDNSLKYVLAEGKAHELPVLRFDTPDNTEGSTALKERYWKTLNKPVKDKDGNIKYIIHHTQEVSEQIIKEKQLQHTLEIERKATLRAKLLSEQMERLFHDVPAQIAIVKGEDLVYDYVNPQYERELFPGREYMGMPLLEALPEIKGEPIWDILQKVYKTGERYLENELLVPLAATKGGELEDHFFNTVYHPLKNELDQVYAILSFKYEITSHVSTRKKLEQTKWELSTANEKLIASIDDLHAIHEELRASNEELLSTNEDLKAAQDNLNLLNAELEKRVAERTSALEESMEEQQALNEELAASNEELATTNEELSETQHALHETLEILTASERKKDEFLSIASHELKTPLTSLKAFNQLMSRSSDPEKLAGFVKKSAEQVFRLEKLINDLLDVTRINAGKMIYDMQTFDFTQMLAAAIESVQLKTENHELIFESENQIDFKGDRLRLEQVINNFLTNAVKYSPDGGRIIVSSTLQDESVVVSVQDFGIGIPEDHLDKLFDRYYRVDNTAMRFEGLGLGLFISSEILKRHHGTFWIESKQGAGTTFYFRLPLHGYHPEQVVVEDDTYYHDSSITIRYNKSTARLDVDWTGFQNMESVQLGGMHMLRMLKANKVDRVLNDNTNVLGNWSEASDWTGKEWFPMMEAGGLKYFAWIYSPSAFSRLAAEKSVDMKIGNVVTQFFTEPVTAEQWLSALDN